MKKAVIIFISGFDLFLSGIVISIFYTTIGIILGIIGGRTLLPC